MNYQLRKKVNRAVKKVLHDPTRSKKAKMSHNKSLTQRVSN